MNRIKMTLTGKAVKRTVSILLMLLMLLSPVVTPTAIGTDLFGVTALAATYAYTYYPKYTGKSGSLIDGLKAVGADSSYSNRKNIASLNGISGYTGSSSQNTKLLNLLKAGNLIKSKTVISNTNTNTNTSSNTSSNKGISFSWSSTKSFERTKTSSVKLNINGTSISNGTTFYTYEKSGKIKSTGYNNNTYSYVKVGGKLVYVASGQCLAYARYCQQLLYGCNDGTSSSKFKNVVGAFTPNATTAKKYITQAGVGAHIRVNNGKNDHSLFVIKVDSDGFYFTDANTDGEPNMIKVGHCTWSGFVNKYVKVNYIKVYKG